MIPALVALAKRAWDLGRAQREADQQEPELTSVLRLDGIESRNTIRFGDSDVEHVSRTIWDGRTLKVTSTVDLEGKAIQTTLAIGLDAARHVVVEVTAPDLDGTPLTTRHWSDLEVRRKAG